MHVNIWAAITVLAVIGWTAMFIVGRPYVQKSERLASRINRYFPRKAAVIAAYVSCIAIVGAMLLAICSGDSDQLPVAVLLIVVAAAGILPSLIRTLIEE